MNRLARYQLLGLTAFLVSACGSSHPKAETTPAPVPPSPAPGSSSTEGTTGGTPATSGKQLRYRFQMQQPANDDFAFKDSDVFIYVRPFEDRLSIKVQGREQNHIKILWNDSEFIDILGRRYQLVPPSTTIKDAASGIVPPTDVPPGQIFTGEVLLLDPAEIQTIRALGGKNYPVVPADAGTPEQIRNREFSLRLAVELNYVRRDYDFLFSIQDIYYR